MSDSPAPVLTIDGPSGSGKGTVALRVSQLLGWHYLDSGALYRVIGLLADRSDVSLDDESGLSALASGLELTFREGRAVLGGQDVDDQIRGETAGDRASKVARWPAVRKCLLAWHANVPNPRVWWQMAAIWVRWFSPILRARYFSRRVPRRELRGALTS